MVVLDRADLGRAAVQRGEGADERAGSGQGRDAGHAVVHGGRADVRVVVALPLALGRVQDHVDLTVLQGVDDVRPALVDLVDPLARDPVGTQGAPGAVRGEQVVAEGHEGPRLGHHRALVGVLEGEQDRARERQPHAGRRVGLEQGRAEVLVDPHHLAGRPHLGAQEHVGARELVEGEDGCLHREVGRDDLLGEPELLEGAARHDLGRQLRQRDPDGLADERGRARGARVDLDHVDGVVLHRVLDVHEADDAELAGHRLRGRADVLEDLRTQGRRGEDAGRVAGVDPGLLDVLHDPADHDAGPVADRVHVDLDRVLQELVHEDGAVRRGVDRVLHVAVEALVVEHDLHGAPAEHVRGPHEHGVADLARDREGLGHGGGHAARRLPQAQLLEEGGELLAVLRAVDGGHRGADQRSSSRLEAGGEVQRGLAAELDDDSLGLHRVDHGHHVLVGERLEEEVVGGVVVSGDGLRIRVDHHRVAADLARGERGVHAAVVELDALTDSVRAAAEDHDPIPVAGAHLALVLPGGVVVGRLGLELGSTGVDELVGRLDAVLLAGGADGRRLDGAGRRDLSVGVAQALGLAQ